MNHLSPLARKRFLILCEISWRYGLIGINEYCERMKALRWLSSDQEEPGSPEEEEDSEYTEKQQEEFLEDTEKNHFNPLGSNTDKDTRYGDPELLQYTTKNLNKRWVFTIGDQDPYPSIPHGHFEYKTRKWPKLNPYTGEIFSKKNKLDSLLKKKEYRVLWEDQELYNHALEQISWYKGDRGEFRDTSQLQQHLDFLNDARFTEFK